MKKGICVMIIFLFFASMITGCAIKTSVVERERVDQGLVGNRGFLKGTPPPVSEVARPKTREYINIDVEMSTFQEIKSKVKSKLKSGSRIEKPTPSKEVLEETSEPSAKIAEQAPPKLTVYKVAKGDTLEKIAARPEIYGDSKKWNKIYQANKEKIKNPNKLYPNQVLNIPR